MCAGRHVQQNFKGNIMYYVVGSGPAGIACATALVNAGHRVTILDAGLTLEAEHEHLRLRIAAKPKQTWTTSDTAPLKTAVTANEVPLKRIYGSDYPYRTTPGSTFIHYGRLSIKASHAQGGFSNVWGGAVLPYREKDIGDWPISSEALREGYEEVAKFMPIAGLVDNLEAHFPLFGGKCEALEPSRQIQRLCRNATRNRDALNHDGVYIGSSRLAVSNANGACLHCGLCLHGCPKDLIYSSRQTLKSLLENDLVVYEPGVTIRSFREKQNAVELLGLRRDGSSCLYVADRAFLAAGTLSTTAIVLRSLAMFDVPVRFKDSQYYLFPWLQMKSTPRVSEEELHTLCQVFVEIFDPNISPYTVHLQVYSFNDHLEQVLALKLGALKSVFPRAAFLGRVLLVQGYLHSEHSGGIMGVLRRSGDDDYFELSEVINPQTRRKISAVLGKLTRQAFRFGAIPLASAVQITEPGRGFHTGGSFPMADKPRKGETDILGRPMGAERVHIADASVFPSIPSTTITLPVMANAYRIASQAARLDASKGGGGS